MTRQSYRSTTRFRLYTRYARERTVALSHETAGWALVIVLLLSPSTAHALAGWIGP